jgi:hypothetical protein
MELQKKYPQLYVLFGACFFPGSEEGLADDVILEQYTKDSTPDELLATRAEMADLVQHAAYWQDAAFQAWRYFPDEAALAAWLRSINNYFSPAS